MGAMRESCSVCGKAFDVQFRYQMEERDGGFSFYCSQQCLQVSQRAGGDGAVTCDGCAKRFKVELVSQVLYLKGQRKYACALECRNQILAESRGLRLGELAAPDHPALAAPPAPEAPAAQPPPPPAPPREDATAQSSPPPPTVPSVTPISAKRPTTQAKPVSTRTPVAPAKTAAPAPAASPAPAQQGSGLPKLIAVFNHKGGTGKTTTSVSLAAGLAMRGKRVLLVDTDAQGNVSVSLGAKSERSLYHVLVMGLAGKDAVTSVRPNLDLIPSNETLAAAELYLAGRQNRDRVLAQRLSPVAGQYDYVVVDCSPSLSLLNQNALCLVDSVLVPVACDYLSLVGVRQVIKTVKNVNQLLHHPVRIWGVLPTFYDSRAKICNEAIDTLKEHFGPRCLRPIRQAIKVKEAPAQGQTIFEYAAGTAAADDYEHLVACVLGEVPMETGGTEAQPQPQAVSA